MSNTFPRLQLNQPAPVLTPVDEGAGLSPAGTMLAGAFALAVLLAAVQLFLIDPLVSRLSLLKQGYEAAGPHLTPFLPPDDSSPRWTSPLSKLLGEPERLPLPPFSNAAPDVDSIPLSLFDDAFDDAPDAETALSNPSSAPLMTWEPAPLAKRSREAASPLFQTPSAPPEAAPTVRATKVLAAAPISLPAIVVASPPSPLPEVAVFSGDWTLVIRPAKATASTPARTAVPSASLEHSASSPMPIAQPHHKMSDLGEDTPRWR